LDPTLFTVALIECCRQESGFNPVIKAGMAALKTFQMLPDRVLENLDIGSREAGGHIVQLCCPVVQIHACDVDIAVPDLF
jgi:hypothetical protein